MATAVPSGSRSRRGRPPRSPEQRAERRAELLAAAMEAIRSGGPEVSVDDIAAAAGVSKPVLYDHFGDKLGLADAMAVSLADSVTDHAAAATGGDSIDLRAAVATIVQDMVDLVEGDPNVYGFLARTIRTGDRGFFDNALVEVIRERGALLVGLVTESLDTDEVRVLVDGAFGFLFFAVESWQVHRTPPRDDLVPMLVDMVVEGFRVAAARPR